MASSDILITVGKIIIARIMEADSTLYPLWYSVFRMSAKNVLSICINSSLTMTIPNRPYTTEGIPARSSTAGLINLLTLGGANSARKIAVATPRGTPRIRAPKVTAKVPIIIGRIPKTPFVGYHSFPRRKSIKPTFLIMGKPSVKMNPPIKITVITDMNALIKRIFSYTFSFAL